MSALCVHDTDADVCHIADVCPVDLIRLCAGRIIHENDRVVVRDGIKDRGADAVGGLDAGYYEHGDAERAEHEVKLGANKCAHPGLFDNVLARQRPDFVDLPSSC